MLLYSVEQRSLDLHILRDDFDDPVAAGDERKIIVEVADGNEPCAVRRVKGRRFGLFQCIERGQNDLVPLLLRCPRVATGGNNIEQNNGEPRIGNMGGDPRSHCPRAEYGNSLNDFHSLKNSIPPTAKLRFVTWVTKLILQVERQQRRQSHL